MKPLPRLRLEPRPSRIGVAAIVAGCAAVATLAAALPIDGWAKALALAASGVVAMRGVRRCGGRDLPALVFVGDDRRVSVVDRAGRTRDGTILDDSHVGARLTTIVWRPDRARRIAPAETILILPDSLPPDDFRRLRVMLRYARAAVGRGTSGRDAGRPSSHARASTSAPLSALDAPPRR